MKRKTHERMNGGTKDEWGNEETNKRLNEWTMLGVNEWGNNVRINEEWMENDKESTKIEPRMNELWMDERIIPRTTELTNCGR